jgi:ABC-2 type transport system permease protein
LFLSETFVTADLLPAWFRPVTAVSPLTYFARGVRALTFSGGDWTGALAVLAVLALVVFSLGAVAVPWTE